MGPLRSHTAGTFGEPRRIRKARPVLSDGAPPPASQPGTPPEVPRARGPPHHSSHVSARGSPASRRTQSTQPPAPGTARGTNPKRNLINSFRIQHFPHSIIFKLNNLSLREKGKGPLSSALPAAQSRHCGPDWGESPWSPPLNAPFHTHAHRQPLQLPLLSADPGPRPHGLCGALVGSWGPGWGHREAWSERKVRQKRLSCRSSKGPSEGGGDGVRRHP